MKLIHEHIFGWRYYAVIVVLLLVGAALEVRLFYLQVKQGNYYAVLARESGITPNAPLRGGIYFKNRFGRVYPAAISKPSYSVFVVPNEIKDIASISEALSPFVEETKESMRLKIEENRQSSYLRFNTRLDKDQAEALRLKKLQGIGIVEQQIRTYPYGMTAANTLGFLSYAHTIGRGQYGIEEYYESVLGYGGEKKRDVPEVGDSLYLTIDYTIQQEAEKIFSQLIKQFEASSGTIMVMDPLTGAMQAIVSYPNFNPNTYNKVESLDVFKNIAIQEPYEPGSVMKIFTMAAGLEEKVITPRTTYEDTGGVKIKDTIIRNYDRKAYGVQTMTQVLEKSLNTGSVFVQQQLNKKDFLNYIKAFGFDEKTKIDVAGEVKGNITNLKKSNDVDFAAASFGQGISVTPLQILSAVSAVANKGILMQPYVVEKRVRADGSQEITEPQKRGTPISALSASQLTSMLVSVAQNGLDKKANIAGYQIAVKTGTAQIANTDGSGYSDETIHTIVGFAPALHPKFAILIRLDKPRVLRFAADTLTPSFNSMVRFLLNYYDIPPESVPQ